MVFPLGMLYETCRLLAPISLLAFSELGLLVGSFPNFGWLILLAQEKLPWNLEMTFVFHSTLDTRLDHCFSKP